MSTVTVESSRFGTLEIDAGAIIEFPAGLIGLGGRRYALVATDAESAVPWLHSLDDPALALPVTNPWAFFADYEVELSDDDSERIGAEDRRRRRLGHRPRRRRAHRLQRQPARADHRLAGSRPPGDQRGRGRPRARPAVPDAEAKPAAA